MSRCNRATRLRGGLVLGLLALLWLSQEALPSQTAPGGAPQPKPLTPEQRTRLKEGDRLWKEGHTLQAAGKLAEAVAAAEKVLAIDREVRGGVHADVASDLQWLAEVHEQREDFAAARKSRREVLAVRTKLHGGGDWRVTDARLALADVERLAGLTRAQRAQLAQARRLHDQAGALRRKGQFAQAIPLTKKALAVHEATQGQDHPDVAVCLADLATCYQEMGRYAEAEPLFQRSLKIHEAQLGKDHPDVATSLNDLALLYHALGRYAEAEPLFQRSLKIHEAQLGKGHPEVATGLNNLALLYHALGRYAEAEPLYRRSLKIYEAKLGPGHPDVARSLNNLAEFYSDLGRYTEAEPLYRRSLKIREAKLGPDHPEVAAGLNNLAHLYSVLGRYAEAEPLYRRSLKIREARLGPDHPDVAQSLNNLASLYQDLGRPAEAEPLYRRSLKIREAKLGPDHPDVALSLDNLADLYREMGRYAEAEPLYKRSLKIYEAKLGPDHPDVATGLNNLALLYQDLGRPAEAEPLYRRGLKIYEAKRGKDHPNVALSLNNLALLYQDLGRPAEAEPLYRQAMQIMEDHLRRTGSGLSERQLLLLAGKSRFFLDSYVALGVAAGLPADGPYAAVLAWKGQAFAQQRQLQLARRLLHQSDSATARLYEQLERASQQLAQLALADPEKALATADLDRRKRDLVRLSEEVDDLQQKLAARSADFRRQQKEARLTPAQLQKLLPADAVLIDFLEYRHFQPPKANKGPRTSERRLAAFVVRPGRPVELVNLGPMKPIAEAVDAWRKHFGLGAAGKDDPAGAELRRLVWQPLAGKVAGAKLVLVSPDGALGKFPFAALPGAKLGTYLLEEVPLVVLPVPQLLPHLLAPPDAADKAEPSLLLVGEVDYDAAPGAATAPGPSLPDAKRSDALGQMKALPGSRAEVLAIQDSFQERFPQGRVTLLRKQKPTEGAVRLEAPKHRYVHLATHGFFAPAKLRSALAEASRADGPGGLSPFGRQGLGGFHPGLLSGIALAGANRDTRPDQDDGILTALEVASLDLGGVDLAVLSACETGLGEAAGGEGLLGLQRAFQVAGARAVVASLWQVDDKATRALMEDFYANLWGKKFSKLEALRQAQLTMLRDGVKRGLGEPEAKARRLPPYYWAAFVLSGDWR